MKNIKSMLTAIALLFCLIAFSPPDVAASRLANISEQSAKFSLTIQNSDQVFIVEGRIKITVDRNFANHSYTAPSVAGVYIYQDIIQTDYGETIIKPPPINENNLEIKQSTFDDVPEIVPLR